MKLLFAILLVIPLAWANQRPADVKFIYSDGYMVAKGGDSPTLSSSSDQDILSFYAENNATRSLPLLMRQFGSMELKAPYLQREKKINFAVEVWLTPKPRGKLDKEYCLKNSSDTLRYLIKECAGDVVLREATYQEQGEVQKFKDEFKNTKSPFKIIYKNMTVQAQWIKIDQFTIRVWDDYPAYLKDLDANFIMIQSRKGPTGFRNMQMHNYKRQREFVIEGFSDEKKVNCYRTGVSDIWMESCTGRIQARNVTEFD